MITPYVQQDAVKIDGVCMIPMNVCSHCGYDDDPESAQQWDVDDDDHRICPRCASGEPKALVKFNRCVDCQRGCVGSFNPATGWTRVICQPCRDKSNARVEAACRAFARAFDLIAA